MPKYNEIKFRVKDLIAHLSKMDPELPVGAVGHYGEFEEIDDQNFYVANSYIVPKDKYWHSEHRKELKVLHVQGVDFGEEPD